MLSNCIKNLLNLKELNVKSIKNFKNSLVIKHFTFIQKANKTSADLHKTYNVLVKAVKMGDPLGVFFLGRTVSKLDPKYAEYCYFNCYNEIVRFALKGNPHCQYVLSLYYAFNIKPIKYNESEYFYWTNCAAANGIVSAVNNLGSLYFDGIGCKQNYSQAFRFFEDAADRGSDVALYNVARCDYHGLGVEKSIKTIEKADIVINVTDGVTLTNNIDINTNAPIINVINKADLISSKENGVLYISAKNGEVEPLLDEIIKILGVDFFVSM